jgi:hypothetical protein
MTGGGRHTSDHSHESEKHSEPDAFRKQEFSTETAENAEFTAQPLAATK